MSMSGESRTSARGRPWRCGRSRCLTTLVCFGWNRSKYRRTTPHNKNLRPRRSDRWICAGRKDLDKEMKREKCLAAASLFVAAGSVFLSAALLAAAIAAEAGVQTVSFKSVTPCLSAISQPEPPSDSEPDPALDSDMVEQLAILIYREAGGDACCDDCRVRVADVALNRVADERFPDTLEAVLTQKKQYGTMYWDGVTWPERAENPAEAEAVARARETAEAVLSGTHSELYGNGYIFQSEFPNLGDDEGRVTCCGIYFAKG